MIDLKIIHGKDVYYFKVNKGEKIANILKKENIDFRFPCREMGRCGNCKIKVIDGESDITKLDLMKLKENEIKSGIRLACCLYIKNNLTVEIFNKSSGFNFKDKNNDEDDFILKRIAYTEKFIVIKFLKHEFNIILIDNKDIIYYENIIKIDKNINIKNIVYEEIKKAISKDLDLSVKKIFVFGEKTNIIEFTNLSFEDLYFNLVEKTFEDLFLQNNKIKIFVLPIISEYISNSILFDVNFSGIIKNKNSMLIKLKKNTEVFLNANGQIIFFNINNSDLIKEIEIILNIFRINLDDIKNIYIKNNENFDSLENLNQELKTNFINSNIQVINYSISNLFKNKNLIDEIYQIIDVIREINLKDYC